MKHLLLILASITALSTASAAYNKSDINGKGAKKVCAMAAKEGRHSKTAFASSSKSAVTATKAVQ